MRKPRISIAGLMGVVVVAAVGLAALRGASQEWFGVTYLLTRGVLGLAILAAVLRRGAARAWWLGFCVFGCGYVYLVESRPEFRSLYLPTSRLLMAAGPYLGHPPAADPTPPGQVWGHYLFWKIGHELWSLVAGLMGGLLGLVLYARSADRAATPAVPAPEAGRPARMRWVRPIVLGWAGVVLATSVAAIRSGWDAGFWAGMTFLLTLGLIGLAVLGAICATGPRRWSWLGAGVLGGGYLLLVFAHSPILPVPTGQLLEALREWVPALASPTAASNARILRALERPIPLSFSHPTPLREVLSYIKSATATSTEPGIPIYLDPRGLLEVEREPNVAVTIDLQGIPLKASLRACLNQIGMVYTVKDGYLWITSEEITGPPYEDPFHQAAEQHWYNPLRAEIIADLEDPYLIVGHCLIALLAAGFGAVAAPVVAGAGQRTAAGDRNP